MPSPQARKVRRVRADTTNRDIEGRYVELRCRCGADHDIAPGDEQRCACGALYRVNRAAADGHLIVVEV